MSSGNIPIIYKSMGIKQRIVKYNGITELPYKPYNDNKYIRNEVSQVHSCILNDNT